MHNLGSEMGVVRAVLSRFASVADPQSIEPLGSAGGLSGAEFWRVRVADRHFCLRRWPTDGPDEDRLQTIHRVLGRVHARGVTEIAVPLADASGNTFVRASGSLWELSAWLPGAADYARHPTTERLRAAMQVLARFHVAASDTASATAGPPIGLQSRHRQLQQLMAEGFVPLSDATRARRPGNQSQPIESFSDRLLAAFPVLAPRILQLLEDACRLSVDRQPCIRDIWHDHVLFTGEKVTGLVDFGAMRDDNVASDVSRLLGSLVQDDPRGWQVGLDAYSQIRPLSSSECQLIGVYDASGVLLSATNWMQWLYLDRRSFDAMDTARRRCESIAGRLHQLTQRWCQVDWQ